jgi:hypothetical protein
MGAAEVPIPPPGDWHPAVLSWYESLGKSGQSFYYEPSDWAMAVLIAESMSREFEPVLVINQLTGTEHYVNPPISGARFGHYLKAFTSLLVAEGDRRRARLELERPTSANGGEVKSVSFMDEARRRRGSG